jgi:hypothetical protein
MSEQFNLPMEMVAEKHILKVLKHKLVGTKDISLYEDETESDTSGCKYFVYVYDFIYSSYGYREEKCANLDLAKDSFKKACKSYKPVVNKIKTLKFFPKVGDHLYLQQGGKSYGCVAEVKRAYTVIDVNSVRVAVQECDYDWPEKHYYNTMPLAIKEDKHGAIKFLYWSKKYGCWQDTLNGTMQDYPLQAHFGEWEYYPYMD